jgi:glutathione synthase/RimK-type ligase-like ATP-grasp enzyme
MTNRTESAAPAHAHSAQKRIPINILFGIPDDRMARVRVVDDGRRLDFVVLGTASIAPYLSKRFVPQMLYLHPADEVPVRLGPGALLNHAADPDICKESLRLIERIVRQVQRPCFNHPSATERTTRDDIARALAGIPGLNVPGTIRTDAATPDQLAEVVAQAGLAYPVLVRVAGSHGGLDMVRISGPGAIHEASALKRNGRSLYVTEFRDFVSPDGHYRKARIVVVGERIFLRHFVVGNEWLLHTDRRAKNTEQEERAMFADFDAKWVPRLQPIFSEIANRLDLDFFGVDCCIDFAGQVLLFEANSCMYILNNMLPSPNMWDAPIARIKAAVEDLIASPAQWRDFKCQAGAPNKHGTP